MAIIETFRNFAAGVVTGMRSDEIPPEASPRAWNSAVTNVGGQHGIPAKRRGASILNTSPVTSSPSLLGQTAFKRRSGSTYTQYHVVNGNNGSFFKISSGTASQADATTATPFTSGDYYPAYQQANNLLFVVNGVDNKKFDGTDVTAFGITRPAAAPTAVDSGVAGNPSGTYEFAISYGNSATGAESSRSDSVSVTVTAKKITVGWSTPADPQIDQVFLHVRKTSLNAEFFRLITGVSPAANADGSFGITADPITVDVTDTQLNALLTLSPDTAQNDPPVTGIKDLAWHQSRMFAVDATKLYYSAIGKPEAFDPDYYEDVNADDGQALTGVFSAFGELMIFKSNTMYALVGSDPQSWEIRLVDPVIGCTSHQSIKFTNGYLYWWSERGPVRWNGSGSVELIGESIISPTINADAVNFDRLDQICAEVDVTQSKVLFAFPEDGETRNNVIIPFNYKTGGWDSDKWDPFDVASMCVAEDSTGQPWVMMGNYAGRAFQWWNSDTDGAQTASGATNYTLSGTPTATTTTTITDTTATFDTTGDGLKELYVYATDAEGVRERRMISSNTATVLTVSTAFNITPTSYVIATPDWQLDTKWSDFGEPFARKHLGFLFAQGTSPGGSATLTVELYTDWDLDTAARTYTFTASGTGAIWDVDNWDVGIFGDSSTVANTRKRAAKVIRHVYRLRVKNQEPTEQIALTKLAMTATLQTGKS